MVRSVQVEEGVQRRTDGLVQSRAGAQIGLLLGREAAGRDYVLQLARTPPAGGQPPVAVAAPADAGKKPAGSKGKGGAQGGGLAIDQDWVVEHAAQVARLLPGGLSILGVYLLCPEAALAGGAGQVAALLQSLQAELPGWAGGLLLHIDAATGRLAAKEAEPKGAALRPADLRTTNALDNMVTLQCRYRLQLRLHETDGGKRGADAARRAVRQHASRALRPALCLLAGRLQPDDALLAEVLPAGQAACLVELLEPIDGPGLSSATHEPAATLRRGAACLEPACAVWLDGALDCRAVVHRRETVSAGVAAVKADVERTLLDRLEVLREAAEAAQEECASAAAGGAPEGPPLLRRVGAGGAPAALALPRRAFVSGGGGAAGLLYCDYLLLGEGSHAMLDRLAELVGLQRGGAEVECLEQSCGATAAGCTSAGGKPDYGAAAKQLRESMACVVAAGTAAGAAVVCAALAYLALRER